jgi:hypothetical protein
MDSPLFFFYLEFDPIDGPKVVRSEGVNGKVEELNEAVLASVKCNSFPESATKLNDKSHVYSFRAGDMFAYSYYISIQDKTKVRGYHQYSYAILTENRFYPIWYRLLMSIDYLKEFTCEAKFELLCDFGLKILKNLTASNYFELPLFCGSTPIKTAPETSELIAMCSDSTNPMSQYLSNSFFIGDSIVEALCIKDLDASGHSADIKKLWESVILEKSIIVLGSTPEATSRAVFAIASLSFSAAFVPNIVPYISITDPSFNDLLRTNSIIGVSNPIVLAIANDANVFCVGFDHNSQYKNGFIKSKKCRTAKELSTEEIRASFVTENEVLLNTIDSIIDELYTTSPFASMLGKIDLSIVEKYISLSRLQMYSDITYFSAEIPHTKIFKERLNSFFRTRKAIKCIKEFDITNFDSRQIRATCSQIAKVIKKKRQSEEMEKALRSQLRCFFPSVRSLPSSTSM